MQGQHAEGRGRNKRREEEKEREVERERAVDRDRTRWEERKTMRHTEED